jgi:hypothetical protein
MVVNSLAQSIADLIRPMAEDRELMRAFHVVGLVILHRFHSFGDRTFTIAIAFVCGNVASQV